MLAVELIDEARGNGARLIPACDVLNISAITYQRWVNNGNVLEYKRPTVVRPTPKNTLTEAEKEKL
ncbi:MAG: hypothetical protein N4A57_17500 [Anaeromicrobium sp.]|jgi:predicted site-specific integrase-resolvase|uniref:hypothetical protein n=1 Tax=Anaeromicrobium sp. TaxID=1929132 RepID=UPI0025F17979|nr:hypothetical protein [Anaeromicrobium sp.]MCT4596046.1 hypothetical protein [Anaeromicrobium sp.]